MAHEICVSAPGKIILHGEHSVVHGKKALACAIGSRMTVIAQCSNDDEYQKIEFHMPDLYPEKVTIEIASFKNTCNCITIQDCNAYSVIEKFCFELSLPNEFMILALSCFLFAYYQVFIEKSCTDLPSIILSVESQLPIGAGLGSSAAFNTAIACVLLTFAGSITVPKGVNITESFNEKDLSIINALSHSMEKIVHKTPSGIDNSIATYGGAVSFQNGKLELIENMPELKLLIVDTRVSRSTKTLVTSVKDFLAKFPEVVNPILDAMHSIAVTSEKLLESIHNNPSETGLLQDLSKLITTNQSLLSSIGVSHPALDRICSLALKHGFPAKLTGAGGGGCAIILLCCNNEADACEKLQRELINAGFSCKEATLGGPGVLVGYFKSLENLV